MTPAALADLLETLVNIPSVTGNERAIADFVSERIAKRATGEVLRSGNAVVWRGPQRGKPLVVLAGHLDTVPAQGNERAVRQNGNLVGLGSSDMKAGDAVLLALIETLDPKALRFDVAIVFYDAEEGPSEKNGLKRLLNEMPWLRGASLAVLLEPTDLQVEMGCNGVLNVEVRVPGTSAHSARPWLGKNAVSVGAEWLSIITRHQPTPRTVQGIEYVETLQITTLRAGVARNVLPSEMVVNLNYRFPPDRTLAQAIEEMRARVPESYGFEVVDSAPPGKVCSDDVNVQAFVERFGPRVAGKQGWTDVARFTEAGVPAFNFGPGLVELCHRADEYCPVENLRVAYDWLAAFLKSER